METKLPEVSTEAPMPPVKTPKTSESRLIDLFSAEPSSVHVHDACLFYRHDFGIMDKGKAMALQFEAKEWLYAWKKTFGVL